MQVTKIAATLRTDHGKGASRRLRASGKLPAVAYKKGADAKHLVVSPTEIVDVLTSERGVNSVVQMDVSGQTLQAMIRDYQYHPLSRKLLHADFIEVSDDEKVEVNIPLNLTGKAKGIVMGGVLRQVFRELPIRCVPSAIPTQVTHDISDLDVDHTLSVKELVLPEGVEVLLGEKRTVALVAMDRRSKKEEEEAAAATAAPGAKPEAGASK